MALPDEPLTRTEQYLNRTATGGGTIPEFPLTRAEQYLNKIATGSGDVPEVPLTRMEQYLDYIAKNGGSGDGGGGSGGGVLMVTDTDGTLDKTMGEIQDAYLAGKRVIMIYSVLTNEVAFRDVIGVYPVTPARHGKYSGSIKTYVSSSSGLAPMDYWVYGETEEATRNAYPVRSGS